jgi:thiamine biosynthesis lipoprotein
MESIHFRAMNTEIILSAEGKPEELLPGFEKTRQFIAESERRFTRFSEDSELSQLNRAAGTWFHLSPDMLNVIMLAKDYVDLTQGLFDPSILSDLLRAGYDQSMDIIRVEGVSSHSYPYTRQRTPLNGLVIRPEESLIFLLPGASLDLGGIAKGWIAEQAAAILAEFSPVCAVDAGGDMYLSGLPKGMSGWPIALEDPQNPGEVLTILNIPPGAVATSSVAKRTWKQGEKQRHHLIDPRTGEPAETDWLSVTVIAAHTHLCEVFAKALLIAGPQEAPAIAQNADIAYFAVDREGNILATQESMEYVYDL